MIKADSKLLINSLMSGDELAARQVVERYFPELTRVALRNMRGASCRSTNAEDIVQSAFRRFFAQAQNGRFSQIESRSELLRLLKKITRDRAIDLVRQQKSVKHGGGNVRGESALLAKYGASGINAAPGEEVFVEGQIVLQAEFDALLQQLDDEQLVTIALLKLEGYNVAEIAARIECSLRTVERRLSLIRKIWQKHAPSAKPHEDESADD